MLLATALPHCLNLIGDSSGNREPSPLSATTFICWDQGIQKRLVIRFGARLQFRRAAASAALILVLDCIGKREAERVLVWMLQVPGPSGLPQVLLIRVDGTLAIFKEPLRRLQLERTTWLSAWEMKLVIRWEVALALGV